VGLILVGLVVAVFGVAGGLPSIGLDFKEKWIIVFLLGVLVMVVGGVWLWFNVEREQREREAKEERERREREAEKLKEEHEREGDVTGLNFKITNLTDDGIVLLRGLNPRTQRRYYDLEGEYQKEPPDGYTVCIIEVDSASKDRSDENYRLRKKVFYSDKSWRARDIYTHKVNGKRLEVAVAYVGSSGQVLWQYYDKVKRKHRVDGTPPIDQLTSDIQICHRISVNIVEER
jgi:hypothetical protein